MKQNYFESQVFENYDHEEKTLSVGEYDACIFKNCDFSGFDFSKFIFSECTFEDCNLSTATLLNTSFKVVHFQNCKLLGLHFDDCNEFLFEVNFQNCFLDFCIFYGVSLKNAKITNSSLKEVDFSNANLSNAVLSNCDFQNSIFEQTNLNKADFSTAINYQIDPSRNIVKKAKFSYPSVLSLLKKFDIQVV
jgi:fluoroquinolone resistance protein